MEFAAITETLLIDADGVYDPTDVNDRMLLGLKSTMGEVELHVMAQRLQAANAPRRPRRAAHPAAGRLCPRRAGAVVIDPDAEVRPRSPTCSRRSPRAGRPTGWSPRSPGAVLRCAPTAGVGRHCAGAAVARPVLGVLRTATPAYVHGRYTLGARVDPDGSVHTGSSRPRAEWPVLIRDHHEGYIGWAEYLANEARLAGNRTNTGARPPREESRCQGIIACGSCGKPMRTNYHSDQRPAYECSRRATEPPPRPAARSPRPPSTTRSPVGCWPR